MQDIPHHATASEMLFSKFWYVPFFILNLCFEFAIFLVDKQ